MKFYGSSWLDLLMTTLYSSEHGPQVSVTFECEMTSQSVDRTVREKVRPRLPELPTNFVSTSEYPLRMLVEFYVRKANLVTNPLSQKKKNLFRKTN